MLENTKKNTYRESSAAFKGMFCTKYRVFKLHIKRIPALCATINEIVTLFVKT